MSGNETFLDSAGLLHTATKWSAAGDEHASSAQSLANQSEALKPGFKGDFSNAYGQVALDRHAASNKYTRTLAEHSDATVSAVNTSTDADHANNSLIGGVAGDFHFGVGSAINPV